MAATKPPNRSTSFGSINDKFPYMEPKSRAARSLGNGSKALPVLNISRHRARAVAEASMTNMEIKALEDAGRTAMAWTPEGYDGQTHYADVARALAPALFILIAAAALMLAIL